MSGPRSAIAHAPMSAPRLRGSTLARIRLSHVWAATGVLIPVIVIAGTPLAVIALAYHLRAGDIMFDIHAVLRTDVFSAVAYGKPWLNQQWLAQIVLAPALRRGGGVGSV